MQHAARAIPEAGSPNLFGQPGTGRTSDPESDPGHQPSPISQRDIQAITCFTPGTAIATVNGLKRVEALEIGDRVLTRDRGFQPVRWLGQRRVSCKTIPAKPDNLPILIRAEALGPGTPERDIIVSPKHRLLTTDPLLLSGLGETEALVEARALVGRPGIMCVLPHLLTYIHVLFDQHEVILSDNMWSESFYLGRPTVDVLLREQNAAIQEIFPQLASDPTARLQTLARSCLTHDDLAETLTHEAGRGRAQPRLGVM